MQQQDGIQSVTLEVPEWAGYRNIDEEEFCSQFLTYYPMRYCDGCFYGTGGAISEEEVRRQIFGLMQGYVRSDIARKAKRLLEALKLQCGETALPVSTAVVRCRNGDYNLNRNALSDRKEICHSRLPVNFNPEAPRPEKWLAFLEDLLYEEDIPTLQQYIGYCLIPTTAAQKMLLIIGSGGEGKSRIGVVLSALMGECVANGSLAKLESSPFSRADLQNRLLMVDDDLRMEALKSTNYIKTLVTAEQPLDVERKGIQSYQARLFCRFLGFGNGNLRALHDRSYGFFRRQIILTTRPLDPDREDNPFLAQEIIREELEGILMWALEGLMVLVGQDLRFTLSQRTRENSRMALAEGNNLPEFLDSTGYLRFDGESCITSRHLYQIYRDWCQDNELTPLCSKTVSSWLIQHADKYDIVYSNYIPGGNGRLVRGFRGIRGVV